MKIFNKKRPLVSYLLSLRKNHSIGFVPTMGALHEGHVSLIKRSNKTCDVTICSIFVNPTQFNNDTDLSNYPKALKNDLTLLEKSNCNIVYIPESTDLYSKGEKSKKFNFGNVANNLEGKYRPGHFEGVATVVEKFFNIINPTKAFFGEKDLQQLQIVKILIDQMNSDIEIVSLPTIRETNGLAKSSRNELLSKYEKEKARHIYRGLMYCKKHKHKGVYNLKKYFKKEMEGQNIKLEYVEIVNKETMEPVKEWGRENTNAICVSAYVSDIRLIDNIIL